MGTVHWQGNNILQKMTDLLKSMKDSLVLNLEISSLLRILWVEITSNMIVTFSLFPQSMDCGVSLELELFFYLRIFFLLQLLYSVNGHKEKKTQDLKPLVRE